MEVDESVICIYCYNKIQNILHIQTCCDCRCQEDETFYDLRCIYCGIVCRFYEKLLYSWDEFNSLYNARGCTPINILYAFDVEDKKWRLKFQRYHDLSNFFKT